MKSSMVFAAATLASLCGTGVFAQTPADPSVLYEEDFEGATGLPTQIDAIGFTSSPDWNNSLRCNGIILDPTTSGSYTGPDGTCRAGSMNQLRAIATVLGGPNNAVASSYTDRGAVTGSLQLQTPTFGVVDRRYLAASIDVGAVNCLGDIGNTNVQNPQISFAITDPGSGTSISLGDPTDACAADTDGTTNGVRNATIVSPAPVQWTLGTTAVLSVFNGTSSGTGNDSAVDNLRLIDVTPQLEKTFDSPVVAGNASTLTFTITNTTDFLAKEDMDFTDVLPAGVTVLPGSATTQAGCGDAVITASGDTIEVVGADLAAGAANAVCTITVETIAPLPGPYTNTATNFTNVAFVIPPTVPAVLEIIPPALEDSAIAVPAVGDLATFAVPTDTPDFADFEDVPPENLSYALTGVGTAFNFPGAVPPTIGADGTINWDTTGVDPGPYTIEYEVCNDLVDPAACATATLTVNVGSTPIAVDDTSLNNASGSTVTLNITDNDTTDATNIVPGTVSLVPPVGQTITDQITDPSGDIVGFTVEGQGTWSYSDATGLLEFDPEPTFFGNPTPITYTVDDNLDTETDPATVTITYDAPTPIVAEDDTFPGLVDATVTQTGFMNVLDATGAGAADTLGGAPVSPATVTVGIPAGTADPLEPGVTLNPDGSVDVAAGTAPGVYSFEYEICEIANPGNCDTATATFEVNAAPVAVDDTALNQPFGQQVTIDPLGNDGDGNGAADLDPSSVVLTGVVVPGVGTPTNGGKTLVVASEGTWTVDPVTGAITFSPEPGFTGDPTPITYTVQDNDGGTSNEARVSIEYQDAPVATDNSAVSALRDDVTIPTVTADDTADGALAIDAASVLLIDPATGVGATTVTVPGEGTWSVDAAGNVTFAPLLSFVADPTNPDPSPINYTVADTAGIRSNEATLTVQYGDRPLANDDDVFSEAIDQVTLSILANDDDPDGAVDLDAASVVLIPPAGVTVTTTPTGFIVPGQGEWSYDGAGTLTFTPELDASGAPVLVGDPTPITYTVDDASGNTSDPATATVTYGDPPAAADDVFSDLPINTPATVNPLTNDNDPDGTIATGTVQLIDPVSGLPVTAVTVPDEGTWTVNGDGTVTFTPLATFTGDPTPISYTVEDDAGNLSNPATITLEFQSPPVAVDDVFADLAVGEAAAVNPLLNDTDEDGTLDPNSVVFTAANQPAGSTVSGDGKSVIVPGQGTWTIATSGEVTFTPIEGFLGNPDPVTYTVADNDGNVSNPATIDLQYAIPVVAGTIFLDDDEDAVLDAGEAGLGGYNVTLFNADGDIVGTTVSNPDGTYAIGGFQPGTNYRVVFTNPDGRTVGTITGLDFGPETVLQGIDQPVTAAAAAAALTQFNLAKSTSTETVRIGDTVTYTIEATSIDGVVDPATVVDSLPAGMEYIVGSGSVNGVATTATVNGQDVAFTGLAFAPGDSVFIQLSVRVLASAAVGDLVNTVNLLDGTTGARLADPATATVRREIEAVFDCSTIIGRVFDDVNRNGYQDGPVDGQTSEPGMPGVRLVTPDGTEITTDAYGRYSVPCAAIPGAIGQNFTLKLDDDSLPTGYRLTSENPRTMLVTAGMMTEMNFGVSIGRVLDIDLTRSAFDADGEPVAALEAGVDDVLRRLLGEPSVLRLTYFTQGEENAVGRARLDALEEYIEDEWDRIGDYRLVIERTVARLQ